MFSAVSAFYFLKKSLLLKKSFEFLPFYSSVIKIIIDDIYGYIK
jgi:hypothetical protein